MTSNSASVVLQFGTGKFLRAFADLFVHELNVEHAARGDRAEVVAIQSTGAGRAEAFRKAGGRYRVAIRGLHEGQRVDRVVDVSSIGQALAAQDDWDEVLTLARSERLEAIVSNVTEAGYPAANEQRPASGPPKSFPARLLAVLEARHAAGLPGVAILPCELLENNGARLRDLVVHQAAAWRLPNALIDWIGTQCQWRNTLVDRIVSSPKPDDPLAADPLSAVAEPFALWLIEGHEPPVFAAHPAVQCVERLEPYHLRKVRILNGAHTALVARALPRGFATVREAVLDPEIQAWLERLLFDEIVPVLESRTEDPAGFARQTLERFANPFLDHRLSDIALHHDVKLRTRLEPTCREFRERFGHSPALLTETLSIRLKGCDAS